MQFIIVENDEQLQQCLAIRKEVFVEEQNVDPSLEIDEYDNLSASSTHFLLVKDGQAIGTSRMKPFEDSAVKLQRIAVLKHARGNGVGQALVQGMEQSALEQGFQAAVLDSQVQAKPFYTKLGYSPVSEDIFIDAGIPHVRMSHQLK